MPYPTVGSLFGGGALPNQAQQQGAAGAAGANPALANLTPEQQMQLLQLAQGKYQLPPAMIKSAAQTSQQGLEMGNLDRQQKLADQLRADAGGQLKGMQVGRVYRAPGAANMIASLMGGMYGADQLGDITKKRQAIVDLGRTNTEGILKEAQ